MSTEKMAHMAHQGNYVDFKDNFHSMMNDALKNELETRFNNSNEGESETTNEETETEEDSEDEDSSLNEKATSQNQQKLMGMAYALKKGELGSSEVSDEVKKIASSMSLEKLKDYASTKHEGLPKKKD